MAPLDWTIIGAYLGVLVLAGLWLARRGGRHTGEYFLGGNRLPWWALGASGMSSNLDVAGTMAIVVMLSQHVAATDSPDGARWHSTFRPGNLGVPASRFPRPLHSNVFPLTRPPPAGFPPDAARCVRCRP